MLSKLVVLADELDNRGHLNVAKFIDNLIKYAADVQPNPDDPWEEITRVERFPIKTLPELDPSALEQEPVMRGMDIVSKLKAIFKSAPNPDNWDDNIRVNVLKLIDRLREVV